MVRWFYCVLLLGGILVLSGCSLVSTGEYFTAQFEADAPSVSRSDWLTDTSEPSFGKFRPALKRTVFENSKNTSVVIYPIIISEKTISFGLALLPLIPVLDSWQNPPSEYSGKMRLLFDGAKTDVDGLEIFVDGVSVATQIQEGENGELYILSDVLNDEGNQISVIITWGGASRSFCFVREKTRCFVPFTSFN